MVSVRQQETTHIIQVSVYACLTQLHHSLALLRSSYVNISQSFAPSSRVTSLQGSFEAMSFEAQITHQNLSCQEVDLNIKKL